MSGIYAHKEIVELNIQLVRWMVEY